MKARKTAQYRAGKCSEEEERKKTALMKVSVLLRSVVFLFCSGTASSDGTA